MNQNEKAIVAGHICLDIIPNLTNVPPGKFFELFQPGLMVQIGPPVLATGGPVSNTGLALHILGVPTRLMGKVGRDLYGQAILNLLNEVDPQLTKGMIIDKSVTTSYTIIISPPGIDRMFLHHPGANDTFSLSDIDYSELELASLFHFGYPPVMRRMYLNDGAELAEVFQKAKQTGVTTSLDMCFPDPESEGGKANWRKIYANVLPYVDIFSPSIEELLFTLRKGTYFQLFSQFGARFGDHVMPELLADVSRELIEMGVKVVLIKLADRGAYLRTVCLERFKNFGRAMPKDISAWDNKELWAPCFSVQVVGTTGSGDATIAGFLCSLLRGEPPTQAITTAVAVGACNVEAADAISGIRTLKETRRKIARGWKRREINISSPGWRFDAVDGVWVGPAVG